MGRYARWAPALIIGLVLVSAGQAAAQHVAQPGRFEVPWLDFRPDGGWRKHTDAVRANRRLLLSAGAISAVNGAAAVTGDYKIPVVLIRFKNTDTTTSFPVSDYSDLFFGSTPTPPPGEFRPYTLKTFYEALSDSNIAVDGTVYGYVQADSTDTWYEDGCDAIGVDPQGNPVACGTPLPGSGVSAHFRDLLVETIAKLDDGSIDWSQYDHDGDGYVDFVTFIQPDLDGACRTTHIWAHRFYITGLGISPIDTKTPWSGHPGEFIKINDYIIQSGQGGNSACTSGQIMPVGTVAHETGHAFGLPDLYDTNPSSLLRTEGIGEWGLMGSGNYARPYSPSRMEAWSLAQLGWVTVDTLSANGQATINPVSTSDTVWYAATTRAGDYFLLENRDSLASDTAQMNSAFGSRKKNPGLLIWHVDQNRISQGLFSNTVNTGTIQGVALEQADGLNQLRTPGTNNRGDAGDSYPGSTGNTAFTFNSNPAAVDNTGAYAGFIIDSITRHASGVPGVASPITLFYLRRGLTLIASDSLHAAATVIVNGTPTTRYANAIAPGDTVDVSVTSPQPGNADRSEFTFLSWSDSGAISHSFVSGASKPDTLIASFSARHKVTLISMPVGGTVVSDLPGATDSALVAGILVQEFTPVTLTATADQNYLFTGWTGDTTTSNATVILPMGRPYAVSPQFTALVTVAPNDAANDLLTSGGCSCLTSTQRGFLDQAGNRNGFYDLGDFLAYADRNGLNPSSPVMQRVLAGAAAPPAARKER